MGVFERLPYLNYHDINLDWLVKQTKTNAKTNEALLKIFHWFQDNGLVGAVTEITDNGDDTLDINYVNFPDETTGNFAIYNKDGVDNIASSTLSDAENYTDDAFKGLSSLPLETDLQDTDYLLINRSGVAEAITGDVVAKQSDMDTVEQDVEDLQDAMQVITLVSGDTIQTKVNAMPENSRCMIIQNGLAISDAPITSSSYMLYTVEKASNNRIYIEATVLSAGVAYEHFFATSSGGAITWRRYQEQNEFNLTASNSYTFTFPGNYRYALAFGLIGGTENMLLLNCRSGAIYQTNIFGSSQLSFTAVDSFSFSTTIPGSSALTVIGEIKIT